MVDLNEVDNEGDFNLEQMEKQGKEMFQSIIERSNDIILITDSQYKIKFITGSVKRLLGIESAEAIDKSLFDFIEPSRQRALKAFAEREGNSTQDKLTEICLLSKNNKSLFFDVTISNLLEVDKVCGLVINLHDITDRKLAEEKLTKANNELDQFIYKTSHDLRAPLLSAIGLVELAQRDPNGDMQEYLNMINKSLLKLDQFIEDINSFYRNEKLAIRNERIDFDEIIKEELDQLTNFYNADHVAVTYSINRIADLFSDSVRLKTIFTNIISNALKYSDRNKEKSFLKIKIQVTPDECNIRVEDNGIGIRQQYLEHIFDIFYRADENAKGSGLGLYIVKDTVDKLGGQIKVQSEYGKGTSFTISIPNFLNESVHNKSIALTK